MKRMEPCDGDRLAEFRTKQGWTQSFLAEKAGYSERLIRNAESGKTISYSAIQDIATALSQNDQAVHPEDLICSPTQLAKKFLQAFNNFEAEMAAQVEHFIHEDFVLVCAGDPQEIPFAGEWKGIVGLDQWVRSFFKTFSRPDKDFFKPEFISSHNTVIAWGQDLCHAPDLSPIPPFWVTLKIRFSEGKLVHYEAFFDTEIGSKHLAQARAQSLLDD